MGPAMGCGSAWSCYHGALRANIPHRARFATHLEEVGALRAHNADDAFHGSELRESVADGVGDRLAVGRAALDPAHCKRRVRV